MTVVHSDDWLTIHHGDARAVLAELETESVQTVVTSPPYWSLRDYGVASTIWGGDPGHEHEWAETARSSGGVYLGKTRWQHNVNGREEEQPGEPMRIDGHPKIPTGSYCACGAWYGRLGLEPTPEQYIANIVAIFRAVRRVLRPDGTLWLNVGDSYAASNASNASNAHPSRHQKDAAQRGDEIVYRALPVGYKAKDRMMMPARVAIALQEDGWWLRDEIVWHKNNPMPSSVEDRTTPAHEMVYLLAKRGRYYWDADAIRERGTATRPELLEFGPRPDVGYPGHSADRRREKVPGGWEVDPGAHGTIHRTDSTVAGTAPLGRNKRSVWTVATQPYAEAHFATFPEKLIEPMILAGAPLGGVVLDPFAGSGTVGLVANRLGRKAVLIDLSEEYIAQAIKRIAAGRSAGEGPAIDMPVPFKDDGLWAEAVS